MRQAHGSEVSLVYIYGLLVFIPVAIVLALLGVNESAIFVTSALALVPLSALIGQSTEDVAAHAGPRIGGILNVTMGNAAELIITIVAIREGLLLLVKASISGSILSNILLVLGASLLAGGIRNGRQHFDAHVAGISSTMMAIAVIALSVPALFSIGPHAVHQNDEEALSISVAIVLLFAYVCYVAYTLFLYDGPEAAGADAEAPTSSLGRAVAVLSAATLATVVMSELLVNAVEPVIRSWGITELFLGFVLIPVIGNAAEHWSAVRAAWRNQMDLSLGIAVGSSLQVALFVAPVLVFASLLLGHHLRLTFNEYELVALVGAVTVAAFVAFDGESIWVEGAQLLSVYAVIALGFFFLAA